MSEVFLISDGRALQPTAPAPTPGHDDDKEYDDNDAGRDDGRRLSSSWTLRAAE